MHGLSRSLRDRAAYACSGEPKRLISCLVSDAIAEELLPLDASELIDPASYASGQLVRDLVGRHVVLQAAGFAQKALQHTGSAHCART